MRLLALLLLVVSACGAPASDSSARGAATASPASTSTGPAAALSPAATSTRRRAEVITVTDGDTIRVRINGQSVAVRYIGIDTPETVDPRRSVQCFGKEASAFNASLVAGKTVELEKDISETDKYGRLLRYIWIDGKMANEELVRGGYAKSSSYPPDVKYQDRFRALEAEARAAKVGLWADAACAVATVAPTTAPAATPLPTATAAAPTAAPPAATAPPAAFAVTITMSVYGALSASTSPGAHGRSHASFNVGRASANVVPSDPEWSSQTRPPCCSTIRRLIDSPRPCPPVESTLLAR